MKRIEMCFIAPHSLSANDYNHLTNVIAHWKYFQIFFFFFSFFFVKFALTERGLEPRQKVQSITSCYLKLRLLVFKIEMHVILKTEVERVALNGAVSLLSILSFSVGGSAWQSPLCGDAACLLVCLVATQTMSSVTH